MSSNKALRQHLSNSSFPDTHMMYWAGCSTFSRTAFDIRDGCQGFVGPDPSTFLNENAIIFKERLKIEIQQKSPSDIAFKRAFMKLVIQSP